MYVTRPTVSHLAGSCDYIPTTSFIMLNSTRPTTSINMSKETYASWIEALWSPYLEIRFRFIEQVSYKPFSVVSAGVF